MKFGFVKTCMVSPSVKVGDISYNVTEIKSKIDFAYNYGAEIIVFPELSITSSTCGDLFYSSVLLDGAFKGLKEIKDYTKGKSALVFIGLPVKMQNLLYSTTAVICDGKVLAFVAKEKFDRALEGDKAKIFNSFSGKNLLYNFDGEDVLFGSKIILEDVEKSSLTISAELGAENACDLSPSLFHVSNGANVIVNPSSISEIIGRDEYRKNLATAISQKSPCAYLVCESGDGESTTDEVYGGYKLAVENGKVVAENKPFDKEYLFADIDVEYISQIKSKKCDGINLDDEYDYVSFSVNNERAELERSYKKTPFIPTESEKEYRLGQILAMQTHGLKKRIAHTNANAIVLGLSGGLDSTLAIIVASMAIKELGRNPSDVLAVTMPCFGTTSRTLDNAIKLAKALGAKLLKVDISKSVIRHLKDIKHEEGVLDVTYENAQARERTQVLMDIANMNNGMVLGTGDLSELALGWATYNGDHMSMYGVNSDIPKTLVRALVEHVALKGKGKLKAVLLDVLDTPVSPELLPPDSGDISQKTEDIVGPYLLHDFFLYHLINRGFSPAKVYYVAKHTFSDVFDNQTILKWLKIFVRRFFNQQFKRSCVPDGVRVGSVALSPRGAWKMPSDAVSKIWLDELENLE